MEVLSVSVNTGQLEPLPPTPRMDNRQLHYFRASSLRLTTGAPVRDECRLGPAWCRRFWDSKVLTVRWHRIYQERPVRSDLDA